MTREEFKNLPSFRDVICHCDACGNTDEFSYADFSHLDFDVYGGPFCQQCGSKITTYRIMSKLPPAPRPLDSIKYSVEQEDPFANQDDGTLPEETK